MSYILYIYALYYMQPNRTLERRYIYIYIYIGVQVWYIDFIIIFFSIFACLSVSFRYNT